MRNVFLAIVTNSKRIVKKSNKSQPFLCNFIDVPDCPTTNKTNDMQIPSMLYIY